MKWQKLGYISLGAVFTLIVSYSLVSWADQTKSLENSASGTQAETNSTTQAETSSTTVNGEISYLDQKLQEIVLFDGKQKHRFKLSDQTQILINKQKADWSQIPLGSQAEIIQNSNGEVRYVVISVPIVKSEPVRPAAAKPAEKPEKAVQQSSPIIPLEMWKMDLHQGSLKVKLSWEKGKAGVELKSPGRHVELHEEEAKQFIANLLTKSAISDPANGKQMIVPVLQALSVRLDKPFSCSVSWSQNGTVMKWEHANKEHGKKKDEDEQQDKHDKDDDD